MKKLLMLALLAQSIAPALAAENKSTAAPAKPAGEAWKNVDSELGKGAKKIGGILQNQGIDTKGEAQPPSEAPAIPAGQAPVEAANPGSQEGFGDKLNRIWFKILGKGDDALNTQRTPENKEPEKSK